MSIELILGTVVQSSIYFQVGGYFWYTVFQVGMNSTETQLHCQCTHMTSFAGGFFVVPNAINWREDLAMFLRFWENPIGLAVVFIILGLYVLALVWARRQDRRDEYHVRIEEQE